MPAPPRSGGADVRARSLCRVHWRLGQALLPEHFERQELAFERELELRLAQLAPAAWGVGSIEWDEVSLARGLTADDVEEPPPALDEGAAERESA